MDTDFHNIYKDGKIINPNKPITIGNHCWVAMNCTILKGSQIPNGSVIAAGSAVTKPLLKERCIYVNNDVVKEGVDWENKSLQ